ncbi:hypothetical protein ACFLTV_01675 [Chloroflexota bacterium]
MKKNWFVLLVLALVMITQLALPGFAYAAGPTGDFDADVVIDDIPLIGLIPYPVGYSHLSRYMDEVIEGTLTPSEIPDLNYANFRAEIASMDRVTSFYLVPGTDILLPASSAGSLRGTFEIGDSGDLLRGTIVASQTSSITNDRTEYVDGDYCIVQSTQAVSSTGTWHSTGGTVRGDILPSGEWGSTVVVSVTFFVDLSCTPPEITPIDIEVIYGSSDANLSGRERG